MVHIDFSRRGIQCLDLTSTQSTSDDQNAKALAQLTSLDLCHNELVSIRPSLSTFVNLKHLNLGYNKLKTCPQLPWLLEHLNLEHNLLTRVQTLSSLQRLKYLNLNWNQLMHIPPQIESLFNLTHLDIAHNHIKQITTSKAVLPPSLTHLDVSYNEISRSSELHVLSKLHNLTNLQCSNNPFMRCDEDITDRPMDINSKLVSICPHLEVLNTIDDVDELRRIRFEAENRYHERTRTSIVQEEEIHSVSSDALLQTSILNKTTTHRPSSATSFRSMYIPSPLPRNQSLESNSISERRRLSLNEDQIRQIKKERLGQKSNTSHSNSNPDITQSRSCRTPQPSRQSIFDQKLQRNQDQPSVMRDPIEEKINNERYNQLLAKYVRLQRTYKNLQTTFKTEKTKRLKLEEDLGKSVQQMAKFRVTMKKMRDAMMEAQKREAVAIRDVKTLLGFLFTMEQQSTVSPQDQSTTELAAIITAYGGHDIPLTENSQNLTSKSNDHSVVTTNSITEEVKRQTSTNLDNQKKYTKKTESYNQKVKKDPCAKKVDVNFNNLRHLAGPKANDSTYRWETSLRSNSAIHKKPRPSYQEATSNVDLEVVETNPKEQSHVISQNNLPSYSEPYHIDWVYQRGYQSEHQDIDKYIQQNQSTSDILQRIQQESMELTRRLSRSVEVTDLEQQDTEHVESYNNSVHLVDDTHNIIQDREESQMEAVSLNRSDISIPIQTSFRTDSNSEIQNGSYIRARDSFLLGDSAEKQSEKQRREESVRSMFKMKLDEERRKYGLI